MGRKHYDLDGFGRAEKISSDFGSFLVRHQGEISPERGPGKVGSLWDTETTIRAALAPCEVPAGFEAVPIDPTVQVIEAGIECQNRLAVGLYAEIYKARREAAPRVAAQSPPGGES